MQITDQIGRVLELANTPKKIVSLVPSQTELLFDLGLEESIVGITKFCVHPYRAKQLKQIVGGTKNIKIEKIKALQPDVILCNKEENSREIVTICQEICTTHVSDIYTIEDTKELIDQYGKLFNKSAKSKLIIEKLELKENEFKSFIQDKKTLKVAYFIWKNPWMTAANNTFINHLLELNKFENIYANKERYPEVELKKIRLEGNPDLIFLSTEPYPFQEEHAFEIAKHTHHAKTLIVNGEFFSWYGSRLLSAFDYFKKLRERIE